MNQASTPRGPSSLSTRGSPSAFRGRGRGRGRGSQFPSSQHAPPSGHSPRGASTFPPRGSRGRGVRGGGKITSNPSSSRTRMPVLPYDIPPEAIKLHNPDKIAARREKLKEQYNQLREEAITDGLMSSEDQSSIDSAIKTKGICTQMCDEKERVERIFNGSVSPEETLPNPETGHLVAIEGRMVKAFRRSAAGTDRQIPEELRTAKTCWMTLTYLFDKIVGSDDRLGRHHKFVWDRTRAIRNDFTIQGFTKPEDVKFEVACYEGIIRFHILSLHQLSNPSQINSNEDYSRQQEIAQLKATFTSLLDRYDTFSDNMRFRNEPEFRAYFALFSARTDLFDTDVVIQTWPKHVLDDGRVQTALKLHAAAATSDVPVGSYKLESATPSVAQNNTGLYWSLLASRQVGYLMACTAEISFQIIRFTALNALWRSAKAASKTAQAGMRGWTHDALTDYLGFDSPEQTIEFCKSCDVDFAQHGGSVYLDFTSNSNASLDQPRFDPTDVKSQLFSKRIVEQKRYGRTFPAILKGMSIAQAQRHGLVSEQVGPPKSATTNNSMFIGDNDEEEIDVNMNEPSPAKTLDPSATSFLPTAASTEQSTRSSHFGGSGTFGAASSDGMSTSLFGSKLEKQEQAATTGPKSPFSVLNNRPAEIKKDTPAAIEPTAPQSPFPPISNPQPQPSGEASANSATAASLFAYLNNKKSVPYDSKAAADAEVPETENVPVSYFGQKSIITREPPTGIMGKRVNPNPIVDEPPEATPSGLSKFAFLDTPQWGGSASTSAPVFPTFPAATVAEDSSNVANSKPDPVDSNSSAPPQRINFGAFQFGADKAQVTPQSTSQPTAQNIASNTSQQPTTRGFFTQPNAAFQPPSEQKPTLPQLSSLSQTQESTTPEGSPVRENHLVGQVTRPSLPQIIPVAKPAIQPSLQKLLQPQKSAIDKQELLHHLCRLGLVQRDGVLDMFINLRVSQIVQDVFKKFQQQKLDKKTSILKEKILQRKYFALWSSIVTKRRLRRNADRRRSKLAASVRAEQEKKKAQVIDMAQILEAELEKKTVQEEQRRRKEEEMQRKENVAMQASQLMRPPQSVPAQQAGQKRKTLTHSTSRSNIQDISMSPMHKRSKTVGTGSKENPTSRALSPAPSRTSSTGFTDLRRSVSQKSLHQSVASPRLDQTKTDYFRLKAAGLDPETPLIPHTAATLALKKQRDAEDYARRLEEISRRSSSKFDKSQSSRISSPAIQLEKSASLISNASSATQALPPPRVEEDPYLKSMREAREALSSDAGWFKSQTEELEKQIEVVEEFRRSRDSTNSLTDSNPLTLSVNGFARSLSGYDYVLPVLQPGQTLSRTEERIRRTGAHGLANKPIGGTPGHSPLPDYSAVAMSKRSASVLMHVNSTNSLPSTNGDTHNHGKKRDFGEIITTHSLPHNSAAVHYAVTEQDHPVQTYKKPKSTDAPTFEDLARLQETAAAVTAEYDEEYDDVEEDVEEDGEEDGEEAEEDDEEEDEEDLDQVQQLRSNGINKAGLYQNEEDYYDEDEEEEEEEEEEVELEESGDEALYLAEPVPTFGRGDQYFDTVPEGAYGYEEEYEEDDVEDRSRSGSRLSMPRQDSRAVSATTPDTGVGSTLDDAIELSD